VVGAPNRSVPMELVRSVPRILSARSRSGTLTGIGHEQWRAPERGAERGATRVLAQGMLDTLTIEPARRTPVIE